MKRTTSRWGAFLLCLSRAKSDDRNVVDLRGQLVAEAA